MTYRKGSPLDRFVQSVRVIPCGGCWEWQNTPSYARFQVDGRRVYAHRWSYEHHVGPIPDGMQIDHLCRNPRCCNPHHLEVVTNAENTRRGLAGALAAARNKAKTHCPHGHPYDEQNTRWKRTSRGAMQRLCRACERERAREYQRAKRAAA